MTDEPQPQEAPMEATTSEPVTPEVVDDAAEQAKAESLALAQRQREDVDTLAEAAMGMPGAPSRDEFLTLAMQARILSMSGAAPKLIRGNPHIALHVAMIGRDLGISPSAAIELIDVMEVQGQVRVGLSPQLLNGQIRRLGLGSIVKVVTTEERCVAMALATGGFYDPRCKTLYPEHRDDCLCTIEKFIGESEFTWEDAQMAGLAGASCRPGDHKKVTRDGRQTCGCNSGYEKYPKRMMWWRACLSTRAEALTPTGWVTHDKLSVGDKILGLNMESGTTEWSTVEAVNVFEARQTFDIEHSRFRVTGATANHEWVCDSTGHPGRRFKRRTDDFDLRPHSKQRLVVSAPMIDTPSDIDVVDAARLGWLVTDGTVQWRGNSPTVTISQAKHVGVVRALFGDISTETVIAPRSNDTVRSVRPEHRFRLNAVESRRLLGVGRVHDKQDAPTIPAQLNHAGRRAMFDAMTLANGEQFCTGSEAVWDCWVILATMLGYRVGRPHRQRGSIRGRVNHRPVVSAKRLSITPRLVEPVWCPTTSLGTWVARLNGQVTITGNSGFCADDYFPEAGLGLYTAEELGALVDADGRAINASAVEVPPGYEPTRATPGYDPAKDQTVERADLGELWELQERVYGLPDEQREEFRKRWQQLPRLKGQRLAVLEADRVDLVKSVLRGIEQQTKAATKGEWTPEAALEGVREQECGIVLRLLLCASGADPGPLVPQTPQEAPPPSDAPDGSPDEERPQEAPGEADPGQSEGEPPDDAPLSDAEVLQQTDRDTLEVTLTNVKFMKAAAVDADLRARNLPTDGAIDDRKRRLVLAILRGNLDDSADA